MFERGLSMLVQWAIQEHQRYLIVLWNVMGSSIFVNTSFQLCRWERVEATVFAMTLGIGEPLPACFLMPSIFTFWCACPWTDKTEAHRPRPKWSFATYTPGPCWQFSLGSAWMGAHASPSWAPCVGVPGHPSHLGSGWGWSAGWAGVLGDPSTLQDTRKREEMEGGKFCICVAMDDPTVTSLSVKIASLHKVTCQRVSQLDKHS